MKCKVCNFVFNGPEDKCPYCSSTLKKEKVNFLTKKYSFLGIKLSIGEIIKLITWNMIICSFLIQLLLHFNLFPLVYTGITINILFIIYDFAIRSKKSRLLIRGIDLWMTLLAGLFFLERNNIHVAFQYIPPTYFIASLVVENISILIFKKNNLFYNFIFYFSHAALILVLFGLHFFFPMEEGYTQLIYEIALIFAIISLTNYAFFFFLFIKKGVKKWIN